MIPPYVNDRTLRYLMEQKRRQAGALPDTLIPPDGAAGLRQRLRSLLNAFRRPRRSVAAPNGGRRVVAAK
jgi:hypothetical protein